MSAVIADSPARRCAVLAETLAEIAEEELAPKTRPMLPPERKAAVRAYWLAQMAAMGAIGATVAAAMAKRTVAEVEK